ncbi:MAG: thymidylate kinase [Betaproteobacteria bacterium]|nr:MAG: thymidylate kinase [Betaproteobacteria bacterium]
MSARGRFITFEGIDGAGKSTQIDFVATRLRERGIDIVVTREPGGTEIGEALRELVLRQPMSARTETLLVFAARAQHVEQVIAPALVAGRWIVCDRFTDATYAYQSGGRGVPEAAVAALERWVHPDLQPDLTFLFDVAPDVAAQRLSAARAADRFEAEQRDFFARVRAVYLERARRFPARFVVLDGTQPPEAVRAQLGEALDRWR